MNADVEPEFLNVYNELGRVVADFGMTVLPFTKNNPSVHVGGSDQEPCHVPMLLETQEFTVSGLQELLDTVETKARSFCKSLPQVQRRHTIRFCYISDITRQGNEYKFQLSFLDIS